MSQITPNTELSTMKKNVTQPWLTLIGISDHRLENISHELQHLIASAHYVFGGQRHLELAKAFLNKKTQQLIAWPHPFQKGIEHLLTLRGRRVVVLASGNPFFFGVGTTLARHLKIGEMICYPSPSCISRACSQLGWAQETVVPLSLCGRSIKKIRPYLQPQRKYIVLSATSQSPAQLVHYLTDLDFKNISYTLMENLGGQQQKIRQFTNVSDLPKDISALNLIAFTIPKIDTPSCLPLSDGLSDSFFENDGQLTRQEIRVLTLCALQPRSGQYLWDIGAGCGSISIEWMLKDPYNRASAIEQHQKRIHFIENNCQKLGVPHLDIIRGKAPDIFPTLSDPDAIFIGGGATKDGVITQAWERLKNGGRIVCNGVTLETQTLLVRQQQHYGGMLRRFQIDRLTPLGHFHKLQPAQDILQWVCVKNG